MFKVDKTKCQGCGACVNVCPQQAISLIDNIAHIDTKKCVECGRCISVCPTGAISFDKVNQNKTTPQFNFPSFSSMPPPFFRGRGGFGRGRGRRRGRGMGRGRRRGFFR